jgi:hypothetical protein
LIKERWYVLFPGEGCDEFDTYSLDDQCLIYQHEVIFLHCWFQFIFINDKHFSCWTEKKLRKENQILFFKFSSQIKNIFFAHLSTLKYTKLYYMCSMKKHVCHRILNRARRIHNSWTRIRRVLILNDCNQQMKYRFLLLNDDHYTDVKCKQFLVEMGLVIVFFSIILYLKTVVGFITELFFKIQKDLIQIFSVFRFNMEIHSLHIWW